MPEIDDLKQKRTKLISTLTRFNNYISNDNKLINKAEIEARYENILKLLNDFELVETRIEKISDADYQSQFLTFEDEYYKVIAKARAILNIGSTRSNVGARPILGNNTLPSQSSKPGVRLPIIELLTFDGNSNNWLQFSETFKSLVDEDEALSNMQKLHYLRSCLKGGAGKIIHLIESYQIAWDIMKERFDNKRIIIQNYVKSLYNIPQMGKESASGIRSILDNLQANLRSLQSLGQKTDEWDTLLIHLIISKIDHYTHKEWEKTLVTDNMPTLKQLTDFLKQRCQILESTTIENRNNTTNVQKSNAFNSSNFTNNKRQVLNAVKLSCGFCQGAHRIYTCPEFSKIPVSDRSNFIKTNRFCFNCLIPGHKNTDCRSKTCKKCNLKHHTLLHLESKSQSLAVCFPKEQGKDQILKIPDSSSLASDADLISENPPASTSFLKTQSLRLLNQVLLATTVIDIIARDGSKKKRESCWMGDQ